MKVSILLFIAFTIIYSLGSFSRIPFADCIAFIYPAEKGIFMKTATATTHFLYNNSVILLKNLLGGDSILASRIIVIISAAITVVLIYLTAKILTKTTWISVISAVVFGLSFAFWRNAEIVEVYTFTMVWVGLYLFFASKFLIKKNSGSLLFAALFLGISLWAHIQNILLVPSLVFLLFHSEKRKVAPAFLLFLAVFAGIFILNYSQGLLPQKAFQSDRGNWVEQSFHKSAATYGIDFLKSFLYLIYNFHIFILFGVKGAIELYKRKKNCFWFFFSASFFIYGFSTFYAVSDNYVFFLPFNFIFAIGIAYGIYHSELRHKFAKISVLSVSSPLVYLLSFLIISNTSFGVNFEKEKGYKGGLKYYLLPWMRGNVGIVEFTVENRKSPEPMGWMTETAQDFINLKLAEGYTLEEIKKL